MDNKKFYTYRYLAKIILETATPLAVGSGEKDIITNSLVARDANGLPYIPGTALAGIIRHAIKDEEQRKIFGFQETAKERNERIEREKKENKKEIEENVDEGSKVVFSSAHIIDENGNVIEGIGTKKDENGKVVEGTERIEKSDYLKRLKNLPIRQHVAIDETGTCKGTGKFDEEVVYKGVRFCFELELLSEDKKNEPVFEEMLRQLSLSSFRIGSGTRNGFGEIKIVKYEAKGYDLRDENQLTNYLNKTSSLNSPISHEDKYNFSSPEDNNWITYTLKLIPDDFFLFGSGMGNSNADITPVSEGYFDWSSGKPKYIENNILIPGSSVKGAISHRVAYHFNRINNYFVGNENAKSGNDNEAVKVLFGYISNNDQKAVRGNVIISDIIKKRKTEKEKLLNHIAIDRFTGGTIDGALFSEEVIWGDNETYELNIKVHKEALNNDTIKEALELALKDITTGMLPLGGGVNRGHGCFSGELFKNKNKIDL